MDADAAIAVVALIISLLASAVAMLQTRRISSVSRMPVLVITYDGDNERWSVRNVGNGPALNIVVAQHAQDGTSEWYNPVVIPAVGSSETFALRWLGSTGDYALGARYSDFLDRDQRSNHFTYTSDDRCAVYPPRRSPAWIMPAYRVDQINRHWQPGLTWERAAAPAPPATRFSGAEEVGSPAPEGGANPD